MDETATVQHHQPGRESIMRPKPDFEPRFPGSGRLGGKTAIITGGDSGIGRACAVLFAREGANVAIVYLEEDEDANETKRLVEKEGGRALLIRGDIGSPAFCASAVRETVEAFPSLDVLVNNAAEQHPQDDVREISPEQLERTFRTNVFGLFYMTQPYSEGRRYRQHDLGHGLSWLEGPHRLQRDQGRDRRFHTVAGPSTGGAEHPRQRCRSRPHLDAPYPGKLR